jgi:peptidoglycan/xylan/chitin deacetylase (PgdA/CDA1 family)
MLNALTIDVEDYYQVSAFESVIKVDDWPQFESRVEQNTRRFLDILAVHQTKATFFILAWIAERQPQLVREIVARGHELASHGYAHRRIYTQSPALA